MHRITKTFEQSHWKYIERLMVWNGTSSNPQHSLWYYTFFFVKCLSLFKQANSVCNALWNHTCDSVQQCYDHSSGVFVFHSKNDVGDETFIHKTCYYQIKFLILIEIHKSHDTIGVTD